MSEEAIQTQRRVTELSFLLDLGRAVASSLQTSDVLDAGVRAASRGLRCSAAYVFLPEEGAGLLCAAADDPGAVDPLSIRLRYDETSLTVLAFNTGQPQWTNDAKNDPRISPALTERYGCQTVLAVPLIAHDRTLGALLLFDRGQRLFADDDVRLASHAAQLLATSIENARLYNDQRRRAEDMALLNEVSRSLAGALELEPLTQAAATALSKLTGARYCFVLLLDPVARALRFQSYPREFGAVLEHAVLGLDDHNLPALAIRERRAVLETDAPNSTLVSKEMVRALGCETVLAVPLLARDESVGAIVLDAPAGRTFSQAGIERAMAVAGQLALAVLSARLFEDLRRSYRELERTQAELIDRERLAMLGELSASIAHEVRNPLGVIFNALGSLRRLLNPEGNAALLFGILGEEADRLNRMVGDLLDYSRPVQPALQPVAFLPLLSEAIAAARPAGSETALAASNGTHSGLGPKEAVELVLEVPQGLTLRADQRLLRQALVNLFLNAFQAMPRGGRLRVFAERSTSTAGPRAQILIADSGPGIPAGVQRRIFQPFFTTKATGTGLGLAVVKRIIEGHGGTIGLRPQEFGAEFELWLPAE